MDVLMLVSAATLELHLLKKHNKKHIFNTHNILISLQVNHDTTIPTGGSRGPIRPWTAPSGLSLGLGPEPSKIFTT